MIVIMDIFCLQIMYKKTNYKHTLIIDDSVPKNVVPVGLKPFLSTCIVTGPPPPPIYNFGLKFNTISTNTTNNDVNRYKSRTRLAKKLISDMN